MEKEGEQNEMINRCIIRRISRAGRGVGGGQGRGD